MRGFQVNSVKAKQMRLLMCTLMRMAYRRKFRDISEIKMHFPKKFKKCD